VTITEAWGFTLKRRHRRADGGTEDIRYLHINPGYVWELLRFRPDAIISIEMGFRSVISVIYGWLFRVPVWIWWGGTHHTERHTRSAKRVLRQRFFARVAPRWISYGVSSTEYLQSLGVKAERILQIQNGVDERLYREPVSPYPLDLPRPRSLFVGQIVGRKGIYQLLKVAAMTQRQIADLSLVVVGDGPEAGRFEAEAARLGIRNFYRIPYLPPDKMLSIYLACDFLVFPTLEDVWGLVANEAILCNLPVIASLYAGCARELLPEENVFDPLNEERFLDAYLRAARGQLASPEPSRLKPIHEVADMIATDITTIVCKTARDRRAAAGNGTLEV
jgi:glycosyltransferase involved in cell wall biosynthesis